MVGSRTLSPATRLNEGAEANLFEGAGTGDDVY